jgi:hypothetical protein
VCCHNIIRSLAQTTQFDFEDFVAEGGLAAVEPRRTALPALAAARAADHEGVELAEEVVVAEDGGDELLAIAAGELVEGDGLGLLEVEFAGLPGWGEAYLSSRVR